MDKMIEFQELIGKLKHLRRTGWLLRGIEKAETVASHSWRMALMALQKEKELTALGADVCNIVNMCLLHDVGEAVVGDIIPEKCQSGLIKISKDEKKKREFEAICNIAEEFGFCKLKEIFIEYEKQKTLDAIIVKNLDKMDMLLQAYEYIAEYNDSSLNEFMEFNGKDVTLDIFKEDLEEIKRRQYMKDIRKNNFIDFQILAGKLKHLERSGPKMYDICNCETVASHCFRSAVIALYLEDELRKYKINIDRVVRILIMHDIGEAIIGDIVPEKWQLENKISYEEKSEKEAQAIDKIVSEYGVCWVKDAYLEFENKKTLEASIAKDIEIYESIQQAYEYIKDYPQKAILREYVSFHRPRIVSEMILSLVDDIELKQNVFLCSKGC